MGLRLRGTFLDAGLPDPTSTCMAPWRGATPRGCATTWPTACDRWPRWPSAWESRPCRPHASTTLEQRHASRRLAARRRDERAAGRDGMVPAAMTAPADAAARGRPVVRAVAPGAIAEVRALALSRYQRVARRRPGVPGVLRSEVAPLPGATTPRPTACCCWPLLDGAPGGMRGRTAVRRPLLRDETPVRASRGAPLRRRGAAGRRGHGSRAPTRLRAHAARHAADDARGAGALQALGFRDVPAYRANPVAGRTRAP